MPVRKQKGAKILKLANIPNIFHEFGPLKAT